MILHFKKKSKFITYINASVVLTLAQDLANARTRKTQSDKTNFAILTDLMRLRRQHDFSKQHCFQTSTYYLVPKSHLLLVMFPKSAVARSYMADFPGNFLYR